MTIGEHPINSTHYTTSTQLRTVKGTRKYYFKTIGYCFRTNVDSPLMLRRFQATYPQGCGRFVRGVLHRALSALGQYQDLNQLYHGTQRFSTVRYISLSRDWVSRFGFLSMSFRDLFVLFDVSMEISQGNYTLGKSVTHKKLLLRWQQPFAHG